MEKNNLSHQIRQLADIAGIDALGFAAAGEFKGYRLTMSRRRSPKLSLPDAKTVIVAGIYIGGLTLPAWSNPHWGRASRLYLSGFFLDVVKPLAPVADLLKSRGYSAVFCDGSEADGSTLPLKLAAIRAGLGWQGKHSLLISRKFGTFLALGGIITNAALDLNETEEKNRCAECDQCQVACPLGAIDRPHVLDTSKCLSNLLQEDHLPEAAKEIMENRVGDCEICQEACPWNKKHLKHPLDTGLTRAFKGKTKEWESFFHLPELVKLTEKGYRDSLVRLNTGIPYDLFHRNVLIAMTHAKTASTRPL
mgnify:CR=1 FL=1